MAPPSPSPDYVCLLAVPDDFRMSKYPGGPSSSSSGNSDSIVSASPSATTVVAIRSKRILLLSRL